MVGNMPFYINANNEKEAKNQLGMIISRIHSGSSLVISGDVLVGRYLSESMQKSLLQ